jgi:small basic protein
LVFGAVVGRWWALLGAVVIGIVVGFVADVEVPSTVLALGYGAVAALAIALGVALRRGLGRSARA